MERAPEDAILRALGFAGICCETLRVICSCPPFFRFVYGMVIPLSISLLAHVAVSRVLFSQAVAAAASDASGTGFVRLAANWAPFLVGEAALLPVILILSVQSGSICVFSVAPRYSGFDADADRDARSVARGLRGLPRAQAKFFVSISPGHARLAAHCVRTGFSADARLSATSRDGFLLLVGYSALFGAAPMVMHLPRVAKLLAGGTTYLAGAAYICTVWRVACVLSVMEDGAKGFRAMHRTDELLTGSGKFWVAASVFAMLDGCAVAIQFAFVALVVDNRMGLFFLLRAAAGVAMAAVLWAAVISRLVAQVVVYFVCKSCRDSSDRTTANSLGQRGRGTRNRKR